MHEKKFFQNIYKKERKSKTSKEISLFVVLEDSDEKSFMDVK